MIFPRMFPRRVIASVLSHRVRHSRLSYILLSRSQKRPVMFLFAFEVQVGTVGGEHCTQDRDHRSSCDRVKPFCETSVIAVDSTGEYGLDAGDHDGTGRRARFLF
ncbi:hypothetical protein DFH94DRAFT_780916 [Russula ochroleuca]|uniref:Uncharacterized protein n=1 Tax=Russula ochroleuca TaxID=152965 RepID=A0A9P5MNU4_9AGAM|nr:hypothetical protein DFH94DRAFT_780916 [Russula ochroleuca]